MRPTSRAENGDPSTSVRLHFENPIRRVNGSLAPVAVIGGMKIGTSFFGDPEPGVLLTQTAVFAPKGLLGFVYWYALYPADGTFAMHPIRPDKTAQVT